jgi:hypothetical protein
MILKKSPKGLCVNKYA